MIKNYLKIALRNLLLHKAYSAINILGLSVGMTCSILILLWVRNELSYDRFHANSNYLYRIVCEASGFKAAVNPAGMPAGLKAELPVIKDFVRISTPSTTLFEYNNRKFEEKRVFYADSNFLDLFSFPLLSGDPQKALMRVDAVLITEAAAKKYFGNENPIGKLLKKNNNKNVIVSGILKNIPANSHLQFDFIMPIAAIAQTEQDLITNTWDNFNYYSYLLLDKNFNPTKENINDLNRKIDTIFSKRVPSVVASFQLQPLTKIHLHADQQVDLGGHGNIQYVRIFFVVAIFILAIACINFMNLATARSSRRAKEVGLRKVVGAVRSDLVKQFLGEALLISFVSLLLAALFVLLCLPIFNYLAGKQLGISLLDGKLLLSVLAIAVITALLAGSYPAFYLSGFRPVKVLKGNMKTMGANLVFRNVLVVLQFTVSIVLLAGTVIVYQQLQFIKNRDIGFNKENLIYIPMAGEIWEKQQTLKAMLKANPLTSNFAISSEAPTNLTTGTVEVNWDGKDPSMQQVFPILHISEEFIDVFKMQMIAGRNFSASHKADSNNYILNEEAIRVMGLRPEQAFGKSFSLWQIKGTIVGVVKDFHFKPLQQPIEPLIMRLNRWGGSVIVRMREGSAESTIGELKKIYAALNPAYPFNYNFLDADLDNMYKGERQLSNLFNLFAILAIFISCLGLYGLSAFVSEQRTKEIGVRKVLGASVFHIVYLLLRGITGLVAISMLIAIPLSWYAIHSWLENFAYHVNINWMVFAYACLAALLLGWLTVSYESIKAAIVNPVKSLKEL